MMRSSFTGLLIVLIVMTSVSWAEEKAAKADAKTAVAPVVSPVAASPAVAAEKAPPKDKNRVLVTVDGKSLKGWQVKAMIDNGAARDEYGAIGIWIDWRLKAAEAHRRGITKDEKVQFILDLYRDFFLATRILDAELKKDVPEVTEEQLRQQYEKDIDKAKRPMSAQVQHITIKEEDQAKKVYFEALMPDVNFDELVEKYSIAKDKSRKGLIRGQERTLKTQLGPAATAQIANAKAGDVLGPFPGEKGFEVIYVKEIKESYTEPFEKLKDRIKMQVERELFKGFYEKLIEDLQANAKIEKSAEYEQLEKKAKEQEAKAPPGAPGRAPGRPPARR